MTDPTINTKNTATIQRPPLPEPNTTITITITREGTEQRLVTTMRVTDECLNDPIFDPVKELSRLIATECDDDAIRHWIRTGVAATP